MLYKYKVCLKLFIIFVLFEYLSATSLPKCLFVSSYHVGYAWSDGIEEGLREVLKDKCQIKQFNMDTKRNKTEKFKLNQALKVKTIIESYKPDVVITADDNAAKYLIKKYYKNHSIPFVFCGVNWTAKEYNFPYENVTGMVEVAPIDELIKYGIRFTNGDNILYLGADTLSEKKNFDRFNKIALKYSLNLKAKFVNNEKEWVDTYKYAQENVDFIILGSNSGINDWNEKSVTKFILDNTKKLSLTVHSWMMPYTILGLTKVAQEQGLWAGKCALEILNGTKPNKIPIVTNRQWDISINEEILESNKIKISTELFNKAKKY